MNKYKLLAMRIKLTAKLILKSFICRKKYKGLKVVHDDASMKLMGAPIAMFLRVSRFDFIVVDDSFYSLSDVAQTFVLAHEYGHSVDKDIGEGGLQERNEQRALATSNGEVVREEAFADDRGVEVVGLDNAIKSLKEMRELLPFFGRGEINCRIKRLKYKLKGGK